MAAHPLTDDEKRASVSDEMAGLMRVEETEKPIDDYQIVPGRGLKGLPLDRVEAEDVSWLLFPYIPYETCVEVVGDGDLGKTYWLLSIAASLTLGAGIEQIGLKAGDPCNVLLVAAEDHRKKTLAARMNQFEGDRARIFHVKELFELDQKGLKRLRETIIDWGAKFVIIDPIASYYPSRMQQFGQDIRRLLSDLMELAEETKCAIVNVRHVSHAGQGRAMKYRAGGGVDITNVHRAAMLTDWHPDKARVRVIYHTKHNWSPIGPGFTLAYSFDGGQFGWLPPEKELWADTVNRSAQQGPAKEPKCKDIILKLLARGPQDQADLIEACRKQGFSQSTAYEAIKKCGTSHKAGGRTIISPIDYVDPYDNESAYNGGLY